MAECVWNLSPPDDKFDFDSGRVAMHEVYLTALGTPCQYINIIDKDAFITPSNSEDTELSSDESISSKDSSRHDVSIPPISTSARENKEDTLSDPDVIITAVETKAEKKWPVIEFSDSDSEKDEPKSQKQKALERKRSSDSDREKSKSQYKKHADKSKYKSRQRRRSRDSSYSSDSDGAKYKSRRRRRSRDSFEDRSRSRERRYSSDSDGAKYKSRRRRRSRDSSKNRSKSRERRYSSDSSDENRYRSSRSKESSRNEDYKRGLLKKEEEWKNIKKEEFNRELKHTIGVSSAFGSFHCQVCDIIVNSEVTYQTHMQGKKHAKALKAQAVPDIAIRSLNPPKIPVRTAPSSVSAPCFPITKTKRIKINAESLIQAIADNYQEGPVPGLSEVVEILPPVEGVKDVSYFCKQCESKNVPNSIMKHLTGFKHYLRCLEKVDPNFYNKHKYTPKRQIDFRVRQILLNHEKRHGRGKVQVEKEVPVEFEPSEASAEPGPSSKDTKPPPMATFHDPEDWEVQQVSGAEHLDTSKSDFYCTVCDSHMNNQVMWEAHVRGKRHLKNIKKVPGESTSKIKSVQVTGEEAHLMKILENLDEKDDFGNDIVIVGLGFIRETQNVAGDLYNCYLCGASSSSYDIITHLSQTKHKVKYLEKMNQKGFTNGIEQIKALSGFSAYAKESMINEECCKSIHKYGEGEVAVYKSKNMFS